MSNDTSFSNAQVDALRGIHLTGSCLSLLGSSFIVFSYLRFRTLRSFPFKLIALLSATDALNAVGFLIGLFPGMCQVQAGMTEFFSIATFLWTAVFAFNIAQVLVYDNLQANKLEFVYHCIVWGASSILLLINVFEHSFDEGIIWCWISKDRPLLRMFTFYVPLILVVSFNAYVYHVVGSRMRGDAKRPGVMRRLSQYLLIFIVVRIWGLVNRLQNIIQSDNPIFILYFFQTVFSPLQGLLNSIVYGLNVQVRTHYRRLWCPRSVNFLGEETDLEETLLEELTIEGDY